MVRRIILAYLSLTRGERNGFFVLALLIMILLAGRILIPVLIERPIPDFKEAASAFLAFKSTMQKTETREVVEQFSAGKVAGKIHPPFHATIQYFNFDPNQISYEELLDLGLSYRVARTLVKYRNSGGRFHSKTDLMKVYGLEEADYYRLKPYITIKSIPVPDVNKQVPLAIELNSADSLQLQGIYGIGPVFAKRIIRYRDLLGGFYTHRQLNEVYGLQEEQYEEILKHVFIDTSFLQRMNLNSVERDTLLKHPYLNVYQADAIIAYREYKGEWKDIYEIKRNQLLPDSVFDRISPYLRIEN